MKWGIRRGTLKNQIALHNKTFDTPHKTDSPERCLLGSSYWHNYPIKNYNYQYNSWGFRGEDYEQYIGQTVNICVGDSTTVNLGGPVEHSWPYLLSKYFDIPTLNFGMDGACFYDFVEMYEKIKEFFKIDKIFVLYNLFDHDQEKHPHSTAAILNNAIIDTKINVLKKHCWLQGCYWQFDPPQTFFNDELSCLYEHFPAAHDYMSRVVLNWKNIDYQLAVTNEIFIDKYQEIAGVDWISYSKFIELLIIDPNYLLNLFHHVHDRRLILEFLRDHVCKLLLTNRDGWHMSGQVNQSLADYFYQQTTKNINQNLYLSGRAAA